MSENLNLLGRVGIVTGAGSGIGQATVIQAVGAGAHVIGFDINQQSLEATASLVRNMDGKFSFQICDVSDEASVNRALSESIREGAVDFLVNAAGVEDTGQTMEEMPVESWDRLLNINLSGPFLLMKKILPMMGARKRGSVVNLGSVSSFFGWPGLAAYVTSKHAIVGLSKCAVAEYASENVRINVVSPGPIDTPLQDRAEAKAKDSRAFREHQQDAVPQGRYGDPDEVASLILFLCSDAAQYINGAVIPIDGGMVERRAFG